MPAALAPNLEAEKDFNYCVRRLVINHVNASFSAGRPFGLFWGEIWVLVLAMVCVCALRCLTGGIYHTHCAHNCHCHRQAATCRMPHGVLQQLVRRPLIAGNCRLLTFIKTINKFTHTFSAIKMLLFLAASSLRDRQEGSGQGFPFSAMLMEHQHVAHVQCINILIQLHFVDSDIAFPHSPHFPAAWRNCLGSSRLTEYIYTIFIYIYQLLCMINARLIFQFISQFPKLTTFKTKFSSKKSERKSVRERARGREIKWEWKEKP